MLEVEYKNTQCNNILLHSTVLLLHTSLNMKVIGSSLTNQIAVIFYAPDNRSKIKNNKNSRVKIQGVS